MTRPPFAARIAPAATALLLGSLGLAALGEAATTPPPSKSAPRAVTGSVTNVRGNSAILQGTVDPRGFETTYYFQYGPTAAYGQQTPPSSAGKGAVNVKVGRSVSNFALGYHYRIVASNQYGTKPGADRVYSASAALLKFAIANTKEEAPTPYGGTFVLRGTLSGSGGALHPVTAQSSAFPYLSAFSSLGSPVLTNAAGAFAIPLTNLKQSTQLRLITNDTRPVVSQIVTARVAVRVTLKARSSSRRGLVRLYGTVTPAEVGATVFFQLQKASRPHGKSESESHFVAQGTSVVRRGTRSFSRFSQVLTIRKGGSYRAYVLIRSGGLVSGASPSVTLHAAPSKAK